MNRAQKSAWFTCGVAIFLLVFGGIAFRAMFEPGARTAGTLPVRVGVFLIVMLVYLVTILILYGRGAKGKES